ncbi:hypothetical protein KSF_109320 [Reticulibacter mediterranei]|uniref:Uncharacterized protein n=1 Tax=Reticulibacter mediterranei TaxID=2778369 RepID=A0A8J3N766_9CHLR|nr:hypothetical protein [Reticulibacter mediterranei]GHP00885.1 hypothetical protein KSF_109320 [Reticulibacter mediterranei]
MHHETPLIPLSILRTGDVKQRLLFGSSPVEFHAGANKAANKAVRLLSAVQRAGVLAPQVCLGQAHITHTLSGNCFIELSIPERAATWYVHPCFLAPRQLDGQKQAMPPMSQERFDPACQVITIGMCLFGASSVLVHTRRHTSHHLTNAYEMAAIDSPITRIQINPQLHPYEIETLRRFTSFLRQALPPNRQMVIHFHIPTIEYWLFALSVYEAGLFDPHLMLQWFDAVERRATAITTFFTRMAPQGATVRVVSPLSPLKELLRHWIGCGERHVRSNMLDVLTAHPAWSALLGTVVALAQPEQAVQSRKAVTRKPLDHLDGIDIGHLSYVMTQANALDESNGSVIHLYGPEELPILLHTTKLLRRAPAAKAFLGLYVHPQVLVPPGKGLYGKHLLFWLNEGRDDATTQQGEDGNLSTSLHEVETSV